MVCIMQMGGRFFCLAQGEDWFIKQGGCKAEQNGDTVPWIVELHCQRYCPTMGLDTVRAYTCLGPTVLPNNGILAHSVQGNVCVCVCVCVCVRARARA